MHGIIAEPGRQPWPHLTHRPVTEVDMPTVEPSRDCAVCGEPIQTPRWHRAKYCSKKCQNVVTTAKHSHRKNQERKQTQLDYKRQLDRKCAHCGCDIPLSAQMSTKYCSNKCRADSRKEKKSTKQKEWYAANKESQRAKARDRMRAYLKTPEGIAYKQRRKERGRKRTPAELSLESSRRFPHNAHVKAWRRLHRLNRHTTKNKHGAHVSAWKNHLKANPGASARYFKSIGQPWRNPHLSDRCKYAVRYRLDLEFRLGEINRNTWRKKELAARNDGTVNFRKLMRERKTCPYCGTKITKENAVADHMDPVKHGGANGQHNLTICCRSCNTRKAGRPFVEWLDMLPDDRRNAALLWYKRKHGHGPAQSSLCFVFSAA